MNLKIRAIRVPPLLVQIREISEIRGQSPFRVFCVFRGLELNLNS
jgi:hypothetical protein